MGEVEEVLQVVLTFEEEEVLLSSQEFQSQVESRNIPAVFRGCVRDWKAFINWNPSNGGLDYLQGRVGTAVVEAMLSRSGPIFYGDLRNHEMVPFPFSRFITSCKERLGKSDDGRGVCVDSESGEETCSASVDSGYHVYLAQVPILNLENKENSQLESLGEDIQTPTFVQTRALASINLWMNNAKSRSSTHYDPHHNLLCVVSGCKQVVLWPPSACPLLYPMPIYGEASNHSSVDLKDPDYAIHSRAKHSSDYSQKVTLHAGDALFIPEGWFHQVDSDELTIAVNYWWESSIMSNMSEHMDAYYLRRILKRLISSEMNHMLDGAGIHSGKFEKHVDKTLVNGQGYQVANPKQKILLHQLSPPALQVLHELVSLVHDNVNGAAQNQPVLSTSTDSSVVSTRGVCTKIVSLKSCRLEDDPVAYALWTLEPLELQNVLLSMVHNFPRTLETLILHALSPVAAEVLTRKFEEIDKLITKEQRDEFYQILYGVFDDQFTAMDSILNGKESFALQAFRNVLDKYLGVSLDGPKL
ncbi:hypothetical protein AQUCO_01700546v1 [Aquilegia coerulea]|uniref:JmjC domain-containing protein n=1 Tax=Aquilegia coerulea TaxID=218851 RepID=A0A2G5DNJ8_AQUCA|nr:hypothetical protein AQUCO_01700546v1 [Aquilegia coerulea]